MSDAQSRLRGWSYERQRLGDRGRGADHHGADTSASDANSALRDMIGVHAAHPSAPLALWARTPGFDAATYRGLDGVRLPAMRGAIHLLPRRTAHLLFHALAPLDANGPPDIEMPEQDYARLRAAILEACAQPRTARELRDQTSTRYPLAPLLAGLTRDGSLMRVAPERLRSNELRYVVADVPVAERAQALAWLASEYLRAFGPARLEDFLWWSGADTGAATSAWERVDTIAIEPGLRLRSEDAAAFENAAPPANTVDLLPTHDPYTSAYAPGGRGRFAEGVEDRVYGGDGDARPVVLVDGFAAGTWSGRSGSELEVEIEVELFSAPGPDLRAALERRVGEMQALLRG